MKLKVLRHMSDTELYSIRVLIQRGIRELGKDIYIPGPRHLGIAKGSEYTGL